MKKNVKLALIFTHVILAVYLLMYCMNPGYLTPFFNNPVYRLIILAALSLFAFTSLILAILPDKPSFWKTSYLLFYTFVVLFPNILLPVLGPTYITISCTLPLLEPLDEKN